MKFTSIFYFYTICLAYIISKKIKAILVESLGADPNTV